MKMWNETIETMPREEMEKLQLERLRATVARILSKVAPTAERLRKAGIESAEDIRSLDDLKRLPFTKKEDLRAHYPTGLFAVPMSEVVRIHASSGTTGKPKIVGYTRNDLALWAEVIARSLVIAGVQPGMVLQNAYGYGLFTGGLGLHGGAELLGCAVVPISGGMTNRQIQFLQDLGAEALSCTPSYAMALADAIEAAGIPKGSLKLRIGIFGAEPWTEEMRAEIERRLGITALNIYGLSEIVGPGVSMECAQGRHGSHIQEDHFLPEVIDPETGQPVPPGVEGELVFTTLTKEALPILRYRTADITSLEYDECVCGRRTVRMGRIRGRFDDMLIIRGVNLYPSEVERILLSLGNVAPHYQLLVERPGVLDELSVLCEPMASEIDLISLRTRAERALREETGLGIRVQVLEIGTIPRSEGKAVRVVDKRNLSERPLAGVR